MFRLWNLQDSFAVFCREGTVPFKAKRDLQGPTALDRFETHTVCLSESGVVIEEISSRKPDVADIFIVTRMMGLALSISSQPPQVRSFMHSASGANLTLCAQAARPVLVFVSGDRDFARALSQLRRSGLFEDIVLLHSGADTVEVSSR